MNLFKAELRKTFSTRLWWILGTAMVAWIILNGALIAVTAGQNGLPPRDSADFTGQIWPVGVQGTLFALVMGIVMMSSEYQYRTAVTTFLITPRRGRVVAAKLAAGLAVGLLFGLVAAATATAIAVPAVLTDGGALDLIENQVPRMLAGTLAALALYCLLGVALGALLRNQITALIVGVLWVFLLEPIVVSLPALQDVGRWLPGGATSALYYTGFEVAGIGYNLLPASAAILVLLGYSIAAAFTASMTTVRREIR